MEPSGVATEFRSRPEIALSPADMMAQQGSRPSWLRAVLNSSATTMASPHSGATALRKNFQKREQNGRIISDFLMDELTPAGSGSADSAWQPNAASAAHSDVPVSLPPDEVVRRAFSQAVPEFQDQRRGPGR